MMNDLYKNKFAVLLLAAGRSRRMGAPKPLLKWQGRTFLETMLINSFLQKVNVQPLVVLGHQADEVESLLPPDTEFTINLHYAKGRTGSVQCGLEALEEHVDGAFIWPVDCPLVPAEVFEELAQRLDCSDQIIIPSYHMQRGHPPLIGSAFFDEIFDMWPDQPLRDLYRLHPDAIDHVNVEEPAVLHNINTQKAYQELLNSQEAEK